MSLLPLFARKEPTKDSIAIAHGLSDRKDTVLYRDKSCTKQVARWPWHFSNCPQPRHKRVTLNCCRWDLVWVA